MDLFNRKSLVMRRKGSVSVCVYRDASDNRSMVEVYLRGASGVTYWSAPYAGPLAPDSTLTYAAYLNGSPSARPFHLTRPGDPSGFYCTFACFVSCSLAWGLSPTALIHEVDSTLSVSPSDLKGVRAQARWEGVVIPGTWDTEPLRKLIDALSDQGCMQLAEVLNRHTLKRRGY